MSERYPGGVIGPYTAPTATAANGIWTMDQVLQARQAGAWPRLNDPQFRYVTMLLPGNGTNGAQNNTFLDSSSNNFSITRNGVTTQGTFAPYGSNWSNYFSGGPSLSVANNTAFEFGSGNFTIEAWVNFSSLSSTSGIINLGSDKNVDYSYGIQWAFGGTLHFWYSTNGSTTNRLSFAWAPAVGQWYHIAATRSGTTFTFFINGAVLGTDTLSGTLFDTTASLVIGAGVANLTGDLTGYISNLRLVKGTALYTSAFTPSTSPLTAVSGTGLLTCQSNRFVDNSGNAFTVTASGPPSVQVFSPFSPADTYSATAIGGSGYFDGASWLDNPSSSTAYAFGTGDFTIEGFAYRDVAGTSDAGLFALSNGLRIVRFGSSTIRFILGATTIGETVPSVGQWFHWAAVRRSGTMYLYINGVSTFSSANSTNVTGSISSTIGRASTSSLSNFYTGFLSSIRVTKGAALYTANFTPPSTPLTTTVSGGTVELLTNFTNAGIIDNAMMNDLYTENTVQISTAQSKFGSGSISFPANGDFTWAYRSPQSQLANNFTIELFAYPTLAAGFFFCVGDLNPGGAEQGISVSWQSSGTVFRLDSNGGARISSSTVPTVNTWSHIAVVRNSGVVTLYLNGVSLGTWSSSATFLGNVYIGTQVQSGGFNGYFRGFIDEFRITNGIARYTTNFTPPTAPFPTF